MDNISQSCYADIQSTDYQRYLFSIETSFDYWWAYYWMVINWKISLHVIIVYLLAIYAGQRLMRQRKPFQLRTLLFLWNLGLAVFSIVVSLRLIPELAAMVQEGGFHYSICSAGSVQHKQAIAIWLWLFGHSKIVELGDTAFIVLRKKPLIFLHWYHHLSVLVFTWSSAAYPSAIQLYFAAVNVFVHSFMYSYYALKVLGLRIPKMVSMTITSLQLLQMLVGVAVTLYAYRAKPSDEACCVFYRAITIAASVYVSYFVLFLNYFIKSYVTKRSLFDVISSLKKIQ